MVNEDVQKCLSQVQKAIQSTGAKPMLTIVTFVLNTDDFEDIAAEYSAAAGDDDGVVTLTLSPTIRVAFVKGA